MAFGHNTPSSVCLRDSTFKPGEKVLEYTYGGGKYNFKITKVKAKLILHDIKLLEDFLDAFGSGDWHKVEQHFTKVSPGANFVAQATAAATAANRAPRAKPTTVIKGSFAEVERRVGMGGVEIPPEVDKPAKKDHISEIETTVDQVTFK
jgi:hypothetical protein